MMFLGLRKLGSICCGHKMFLNKIRNIFCVRNKCCARGQTGKHLCRQQCVLVCQFYPNYPYSMSKRTAEIKTFFVRSIIPALNYSMQSAVCKCQTPRTEQIYRVTTFKGKIGIHFLQGIHPPSPLSLLKLPN